MKRLRTIAACCRITLAAALVELRRWNKRRALVCSHGCDFRPHRQRVEICGFTARIHALDFPGHLVKVKRFG